MTLSIKVVDARKIRVQETGEMLLSVQFEIISTTPVDGGEPIVEVVHTARHGFPLDTNSEQLTAELQKVLATYVTDSENAARNAEFAAADAQADATIEDMIGKEISN